MGIILHSCSRAPWAILKRLTANKSKFSKVNDLFLAKRDAWSQVAWPPSLRGYSNRSAPSGFVKLNVKDFVVGTGGNFVRENERSFLERCDALNGRKESRLDDTKHFQSSQNRGDRCWTVIREIPTYGSFCICCTMMLNDLDPPWAPEQGLFRWFKLSATSNVRLRMLELKHNFSHQRWGQKHTWRSWWSSWRKENMVYCWCLFYPERKYWGLNIPGAHHALPLMIPMLPGTVENVVILLEMPRPAKYRARYYCSDMYILIALESDTNGMVLKWCTVAVSEQAWDYLLDKVCGKWTRIVPLYTIGVHSEKMRIVLTLFCSMKYIRDGLYTARDSMTETVEKVVYRQRNHEISANKNSGHWCGILRPKVLSWWRRLGNLFWGRTFYWFQEKWLRCFGINMY